MVLDDLFTDIDLKITRTKSQEPNHKNQKIKPKAQEPETENKRSYNNR